MKRREKERLLDRAVEGQANPEEWVRLEELLKTDPAFRKAYKEAHAGHQALEQARFEPLPEDLRDEIRRAVAREPRAEAQPAARQPVRFGAWVAGMLSRLTASARPRRSGGRLVLSERPRRVLVPVVVVVSAILAAVIWQLVPERASARRSIAVIGFHNDTGDPAFDYLQETIAELLVTSLEQSGQFRVTTMQRFRDLFRQRGEDPEAAMLDEGAALEICRRAGIEAVVVGSYTRTGSTLVTAVKVLETGSGRSLRTAESRGEGPASILRGQIDEIGRAVVQGAGDPSLESTGPASRVIDATTSSLEAYNDYLQGRDQLERFLFAEARRSLEKAVAIDSTFAVAHLHLSRAYGSLREYEAQEAALRKAKRFAARAPERQRLYIEASYASLIENDGDKRYRILRDLVERYPAEKHAHLELGGYYAGINLTVEALSEFQKALDLDPDFGPALNQMAYTYTSLGDYAQAVTCLERYSALRPGDPNPVDSMAELYFRMGRLDESAAKYREVLDAHPDFIQSWLALAYVAALKEDYEQTYRCIDAFTAHAPSEGIRCEGLWVKAYYDDLLGRWDRSLDAYQSLRRDMAEIPYWPGVTNWILGYLHTDRGEYDLALEVFDRWGAWLEGADPSSVVFNSYARAMTRCHVELRQGDIDRARETLTEMKRLLPGLRDFDQEDLAYKTFLAEAYSAELALAGDSVDAAISIAEGITAPVPAMNTYSIAIANTHALGDVLARAYWRKGDLERARAEYERLTRRAGASPGGPSLLLIQPLYHYRFGRVLEEMGDWNRARTEYESFLEIWQEADPDHPELEDARRRLAQLPLP